LDLSRGNLRTAVRVLCPGIWAEVEAVGFANGRCHRHYEKRDRQRQQEGAAEERMGERHHVGVTLHVSNEWLRGNFRIGKNNLFGIIKQKRDLLDGICTEAADLL